MGNSSLQRAWSSITQKPTLNRMQKPIKQLWLGVVVNLPHLVLRDHTIQPNRFNPPYAMPINTLLVCLFISSTSFLCSEDIGKSTILAILKQSPGLQLQTLQSRGVLYSFWKSILDCSLFLRENLEIMYPLILFVNSLLSWGVMVFFYLARFIASVLFISYSLYILDLQIHLQGSGCPELSKYVPTLIQSYFIIEVLRIIFQRFANKDIFLMEQRPKLLIFGGTVFIGKTFLDHLVRTNQKYDIYCLNRGSVYWDDAVKKEHPDVKHVFCDRKKPQEVKKVLTDLSTKVGINSQNKWKAVLDFSAYFDTYIEPTTVLSDIIEKYIIISTDSVYNNSLSRIKNPVPEDVFNIVEEQPKVQKQPIADDYGYNKMKCETFLNRNKPYPFICLRLPDVLGEHDQFQSSQRVWCSQQWVNLSVQHPIKISEKDKTHKLSFVDSYDVSKIVADLINQPIPPHSEYNLACDQTPTLFEFYKMIGQCLKMKEIKFVETKDEIQHFFPSVHSGVIDCSRAKKELNFKATPLKQTVARFVDFYVNKAPSYPKELAMMEKQFAQFIEKVK